MCMQKALNCKHVLVCQVFPTNHCFWSCLWEYWINVVLSQRELQVSCGILQQQCAVCMCEMTSKTNTIILYSILHFQMFEGIFFRKVLFTLLYITHSINSEIVFFSSVLMQCFQLRSSVLLCHHLTWPLHLELSEEFSPNQGEHSCFPLKKKKKSGYS